MNHRSNQDDLLQEMPLEIFPENNPNNPPEDNPNEPDPNNPDATSQESQNESLSQPDQEPENLTPEDSQNDPMNSPEGEPTDTLASEDQELLYTTSHEPSNAFTCEESGNLSWSCEFDIHLEEPLGTRVPTTEETWLLLATASKKQRTEVKLSSLNSTELTEFQQAKQAEVDNWIKTGTISAILRNQTPEEQILLRCRWILTWKPLDNVNHGEEEKSQKEAKISSFPKTHKAKARLVVLGYLDPKLEEVPRDSPTLNKTSRMIILQTIASHTWKMRSFDIKAALLQGQPQSDRVIAIDPVP